VSQLSRFAGTMAPAPLRCQEQEAVVKAAVELAEQYKEKAQANEQLCAELEQREANLEKRMVQMAAMAGGPDRRGIFERRLAALVEEVRVADVRMAQVVPGITQNTRGAPPGASLKAKAFALERDAKKVESENAARARGNANDRRGSGRMSERCNELQDQLKAAEAEYEELLDAQRGAEQRLEALAAGEAALAAELAEVSAAAQAAERQRNQRQEELRKSQREVAELKVRLEVTVAQKQDASSDAAALQSQIETSQAIVEAFQRSTVSVATSPIEAVTRRHSEARSPQPEHREELDDYGSILKRMRESEQFQHALSKEQCLDIARRFDSISEAPAATRLGTLSPEPVPRALGFSPSSPTLTTTTTFCRSLPSPTRTDFLRAGSSPTSVTTTATSTMASRHGASPVGGSQENEDTLTKWPTITELAGKRAPGRVQRRPAKMSRVSTSGPAPAWR